jgi:ABC-type multidrug transport system fused ATPase/permease subunit
VLQRGIRIIGSYIAAHPLPFAIAVGGAAVYAAATVGSTIVLGRVVDDVVVPGLGDGVASSTVLRAALAIVAVGLVRAGGIVTRRYFAGMTGARMQATLRTRVVERYLELPLAYHRAHPTGELLAHAQADIDAATEVIHPLPYSTAVVLLIVFAVAALVATDPFLALIGCTILPLLAYFNRLYMARVEQPLSRALERIGDLSAVAHESIDGALVVKTLGREAAEVERFAERADAIRDERMAAGRLRATFEPLFTAVPNLTVIVVLLVGAWRISQGAISTGELVRFVSLFLILAFPLRVIGFALSDLPRAVVGRERLEEVFSEPLTMRPAAEALALPEGPLGVSVRSVAYGHGPHRVLDGLSLEVEPGATVAIVGPTGSGKSTLAELLVRLADPDLGSVRIGGVDLRHLDASRLREEVAIVFQDSFLFAVSVRDNIALQTGASDDEIVRAARIAQADAFIRALPDGYDTVVGERGLSLSGGQRQRVALARALVRRPRLLILDDATSSVDPTIEAAILEGLRTEVSATRIIVAYRGSTLALADRVAFLDGGRIVAEGRHEDLLASHPGYAAIVRADERGAA